MAEEDLSGLDVVIARLRMNIASLRTGIAKEENRKQEFLSDLAAHKAYEANGSAGREPFGEKLAIEAGLVAIDGNIRAIGDVIQKQEEKLIRCEAEKLSKSTKPVATA